MHKFFICEHCGNLVGMVKNKDVPISCCGENMKELVPNTVEASVEKHLPVVELKDNEVVVTVGSVEHPMTEEHYIEFIYIETTSGGQRKKSKKNQEIPGFFTPRKKETHILRKSYESDDL